MSQSYIVFMNNLLRFYEVDITNHLQIHLSTNGSYFFIAVQKSNRKFTKREGYKYSDIFLTMGLNFFNNNNQLSF